MTRLRARGDDGQVAGIEALPFGVLVAVVGTLLVASAWSVVDLQQTLTVATREGARTFVEHGSAAEAIDESQRAVAGLGRQVDAVRVVVDDGGGGRCDRVTVRAAARVRAVAVPWLGLVGPSVTVRAQHSELIDPYRSGLSGGADCAE